MRPEKEYKKTAAIRKVSAAAAGWLLMILLAAVMNGPVYGASESSVPTEASYEINGTVLPLSEDGYLPGDYRGAGMCWQFARHIYYSIWERFFYQYPGSDDDMLREYPTGEERRITAENSRLFLTAAPVGAVIRLQGIAEGPDSIQCNRHSLILLDKTDAGCTVYHDWKGYSCITTLTWEEFEEMFREEVDFGYFKYIKYPGAEALSCEYTEDNADKELIISTKIMNVTEITQKKR